MLRLLTKIRHKIYLAVIILIILFFVLFIIQNTEQIQIAFLFWTIPISRALVLLGTLLIGILIGTIATIVKGIWDQKATSTSDVEKSKLQNKILEQDDVITDMQSERLKFKLSLEEFDTKSQNAIDRIDGYKKKQRITDAELTISIADLDDANQSISVLKTEIDRLHEEIEARELIEKMIQHDLRSALIASASLPESVLSDPNLTDKQKIIVRLIRDSGEKMLEILDSSLTLYRIEEGTYAKEFTTVNLFKIITTIVERIASSHSNYEHEISITCMDADGAESDIFPVTGDKFLLYSIFMNLLTNALEASPQGKPISVILSKNKYCSIAISNYGSVPESIRDTFFNKMVTSGKEFGTGLGTYLAMMMVKAQNGNIELNSSNPEMTTIYVHLPKT
ncbi:HAMP domain-containing sensor histidine kinase [Maridesulfovibrio sp.]|uniref:HAMP domain-containing sensor histidine kinase n=1 Tax=Maridesulfovibrio sp. TaxID=2795000 RepID=UPI002A188C77|nr:HAMP domain-containing sensor histidine kinase [Maridesulfovibrio sp.]